MIEQNKETKGDVEIGYSDDEIKLIVDNWIIMRDENYKTKFELLKFNSKNSVFKSYLFFVNSMNKEERLVYFISKGFGLKKTVSDLKTKKGSKKKGLKNRKKHEISTHFKSNQINKSCGYIYPLSAKTTDWKITK